MSKKATSAFKDYLSPPATLDDSPFYGFKLDEYQKKFRDAIWNPDKLIVFCNARSGSGKTTIATATANLLIEYGVYNNIVYICSPYGESKQGYLPGSITEKSEIYFEPLYQAFKKIRVSPDYITTEDNMALKNSSGYVECYTHTFLRGTNFEHKVVIIDEAQNFTFMDLKKTLTRISDNCKVIVIGHDKQCDIPMAEHENAFIKYLHHFESDDRCEVCELVKNYRGWISTHADNASN